MGMTSQTGTGQPAATWQYEIQICIMPVLKFCISKWAPCGFGFHISISTVCGPSPPPSISPLSLSSLSLSLLFLFLFPPLPLYTPLSFSLYLSSARLALDSLTI